MADGASIAYNIPLSLQLHGPLEVTTLERALGEIVRRHGILRTTFDVAPGSEEPEQIIHSWQPFRLKIRDREGSEPDKSVTRMVRDHIQESFDLKKGPLFRAVLIRVQPNHHVLVLSMHHIVSDGWSAGIIVSELKMLYESFSSGESASPLPELPLQYVDYANWQLKRIDSPAMRRQLDYWREKLRPPLPASEMPARSVRPNVYDDGGAERIWRLDRSLSDGLKQCCRRYSLTPFMALIGAFKLLIHRYSGEREVVVGTAIAGRGNRQTEALIGVFVNTLAIRTDLSGNPSVAEMLNRVRESSLGAFANQDAPFEKLVEELQPQRDLSRNPFFQMMFVLQNAPIPKLQMHDISIEPLILESTTSKFDMTMAMMEEEDGGFRGWLEFNTSLFDRSFVSRMIGHYQTIVQQMAGDHGVTISEIELLSKAERQALLTEWNDTELDPGDELLLPELFASAAGKFRDAIAISFGEHHLCYSELDLRSNQLARCLSGLGIGPEGRAGVLTDRTPAMIVALLAILKAGGVYVPIDPAYPAERIEYMLADSRMQVLLCHDRFSDLSTDRSVAKIRLDSDWDKVACLSGNPPNKQVLPDNLSHLIYTSGSTGRPKAVAIRHKSLATLMAWSIDTFGPDGLAAVPASTSICFDLSVFEIFAPLCCGGTVHLVNSALELADGTWAGALSLVNTVPSAMASLVERFPKSIRILNLAGEALKEQLVSEVFQKTGVERLYNLYGPSEDTTYSTYASFCKPANAKSPTIGRPVTDTRAYVLDEYMDLAPLAATGHLHLSGDGLARGYFNGPGATAEKFVPCPFARAAGERMYKTGDLVRQLSDGRLDYLGRVDHQVKIRGYRIEIGEIVAALSAHPCVKDCCVLAREDTPGEKRLVAYAVLHGEAVKNPATTGSPVQVAEHHQELSLRAYLRTALPEFMIPSAILILERMPLTPNGKLNRSALPSTQDLAQRHHDFQAPVTDAERSVAAIFSELLGYQEISRTENFFDLGGHSLAAVKLVSRLSHSFGVSVPLRLAFEFPTVALLAESLSRIEASAFAESTPIERISRPDPPNEDSLLARLDELSDREIEAILLDIEAKKNQAAIGSDR